MMNVPQHIVDLLEDYRDGKLDDAALARLISWLNESEENGECLASWFLAEAELLEAVRIADMCAVFQSLPYDVRAGNLDLPPAAAVRRWRYRPAPWLTIAAVLFIAIGTVLFSTRQLDQNRRGQTASAQTEPASAGEPAQQPLLPSPAVLGRLARCIWAEGMNPLRVGQEIAAGTTIRIQSGRAQLVFENGAEVVLQGPCNFQIDDSTMCRLWLGSVSAEVPPRAAGFTIRGPNSEVIDLGTRFGFSVGVHGDSEVHVFKGEVISRQLDERGRVVGDEFRLKENQAVLFPGERRQAQRLAANEAKFAAKIRPLWRRDNVEPLVIDRKLALWLRAAHGVQTDKERRVVAWQDLTIGDNKLANDAFQPNTEARPKLVRNAIGSRTAIRFDGKAGYLTTTPMTTTDDQTIVAVFQYAAPPSGAQRTGGQIINYNGPPSRYLPDIHSPGVLQLGEKIMLQDGPLLSIAAKAFVGKDPSGSDVSAGIVVSEPLGHSQPRVVTYTYNHAQNSATLYVDGRLAATATAPTKVAVTSRKVIGKHGIFNQWYFHGDLAELAIFNTALNASEVAHLSHQLMDYYQIQPDGERQL